MNWKCGKDLSWASCGDLTIDGASVGGMTLQPRSDRQKYRNVSCMAEMSFAENPDEPFRFGRCDLPIAPSTTTDSDGKSISFF